MKRSHLRSSELRQASRLPVRRSFSEGGSLLAFVSQVPVYIRLVLEIHRWPRGLSSLVRASTRRYYFSILKIDRDTAKHAMLLSLALSFMLVELVSILPCQKRL